MKFNNIELDSSLIKIALLIIGLILAYFFLIKLIYIFLPFIIAIIIVLIIEPLYHFLKIKQKLLGYSSFYIFKHLFRTGHFILMVLGSSIYVELNKLYKHLPVLFTSNI